jgi:hypothetical protein
LGLFWDRKEGLLGRLDEMSKELQEVRHIYTHLIPDHR